MTAPTVNFVKKPAYMSIIDTFMSFLSTSYGNKKNAVPFGESGFYEQQRVKSERGQYCTPIETIPFSQLLLTASPKGTPSVCLANSPKCKAFA